MSILHTIADWVREFQDILTIAGFLSAVALAIWRGATPVKRFFRFLGASAASVGGSIANSIQAMLEGLNPRIVAAFVGAVLVVVVLCVASVKEEGLLFNAGGARQQASASRDVNEYHTVTPGKACDKGQGQWITSSSLSIDCLPTSINLTYNGDGVTFYEIWFTGSNHTQTVFSADYAVQATVSFPSGANARFGVGIRGSNSGPCGYVAWIGSDASWVVERYTTNGGFDATLDTGALPTPAGDYTLQFMAQGSSIKLKINGVEVSVIADDTQIPTAHICLDMEGVPNDRISVSNFSYAPLSP